MEGSFKPYLYSTGICVNRLLYFEHGAFRPLSLQLFVITFGLARTKQTAIRDGEQVEQVERVQTGSNGVKLEMQRLSKS